MSEWQPIDGAPKDGRSLILWDGFSVFEGFWNGTWETISFSVRPHTSHWMPLPKAPDHGDTNG